MSNDADRRADEELISAAATPRRRAMVRVLGGLASIVLCSGCCLWPVVTLFLGHPNPVIGPVVATLAVVLCHALFQSLGLQRRLHARFRPSAKKERQRATEAVARGEGRVRVLLLSAWLLPHGGSRWIRVVIEDGDPPRAELEAAGMGHRWEEDPRTLLARRRVALDGDEAESIRELFEAVDDGDVVPPATPVKDGLRFELDLSGPRAGTARNLRGNLSAVRPEDADHPVVVLTQTILTRGIELLEIPGVIGSCTAEGEIRIDEV